MNDWEGIDRVVDENPHWQKISHRIFVAALYKS
jgi:hypothetical protein